MPIDTVRTSPHRPRSRPPRGSTGPSSDRARTIKRRLSLAFQRSLARNNDFRSALLTEPTGDVPTYLLEAFEERYGPSDASTEAKQRFAGAYNSLRARLGLKGKIDENF